MKKILNPFDCAGQICEAMKKGILLTTKAGEQINTMTIGWGHIGIEWGKPIFVAYVRESRYTKEMLEKNGEFTVNVPNGTVDSKAIGFCGSKSGRDIDKIKELGLTPEEPMSVSVPGIKEFPLTLECKVIYKQKQDLSVIPEDLIQRYYPADEAGFRDYHIAYYGEILNAYLITE